MLQCRQRGAACGSRFKRSQVYVAAGATIPQGANVALAAHAAGAFRGWCTRLGGQAMSAPAASDQKAKSAGAWRLLAASMLPPSAGTGSLSEPLAAARTRGCGDGVRSWESESAKRVLTGLASSSRFTAARAQEAGGSCLAPSRPSLDLPLLAGLDGCRRTVTPRRDFLSPHLS